MVAGFVLLSFAASPAAARAPEGQARDALRIAVGKAERAGHPLAPALAEWDRLRRPDAGVSFAEIRAFLDRHPDWPERRRLMRRAEEAMPDGFSGAEARAWFTRFPPLTGPGRQRLAEALIAGGETAAGRRMLRDAWIEADFPRNLERRFLKKYRRLLRVADHNRRLDRLLWDGRRGAARRLLRHAARGHARLGEARLRLMARQSGVDRAIRRVPRALRRHPGLVYERIRWRRRSGKDAGARELLLNPPAKLGRPGKWWFEQSYQIREAIRDRLFDDAYTIASKHKQTADGPFSEAEWLAGWIALRFLRRPAAAGRHFSAMYDRVRFPISRARAAYWMARAAAAAGDADRASVWYRRAARHPTAFYGQLAGRALSRRARFPVEEPAIPPGLGERFEARPVVQAARILGEAGDFKTLRIFVTHLSRRAETPGEHFLVSRIGLAYGAPHISVRAAKRAARNGARVIAEAYPLAFREADIARLRDAPELALLLGLARQESEFDPIARSRAGARGLMQLMPRTARQVSRRLGVRYSASRLTRDRRYNIALGTTYLSGLLDRYQGDRALALAAYNAGPHRVDAWLRLNGDPRDGAVDPVDWIELVPFAETRNYVQRVLESVTVYRYRLNAARDSADAGPRAGTGKL